jgi:hypothetical protein
MTSYHHSMTVRYVRRPFRAPATELRHVLRTDSVHGERGIATPWNLKSLNYLVIFLSAPTEVYIYKLDQSDPIQFDRS